jgi:NAD(P)-dependent dehydrogenase (short-subunit alcohol dehydrogenase family)
MLFLTLLLRERDTYNRKIRVNAISPGPIDTPSLRGFVSGLGQSDEQFKTNLVSTVPMERQTNYKGHTKLV